MARVGFAIDSTATPQRIIAALTDFSARRPDTWPGLARDQYRVYEVGDTWADVREGSSSPIWARERYDWSVPGTVTWTATDSSFSRTGDSVSATIRPGAAGGSRVHVVWDRRGRNAKGKLLVAIMALLRALPFKRSFAAGLRRIEADGA